MDKGELSEKLHSLEEAAIEAEYETGVREETEAEAKRHVLYRMGRISLGILVALSESSSCHYRVQAWRS